MDLGDIASPPIIPRHGRADRRVPGWAAALLDRMARDRPPVVTREEVVPLGVDFGEMILGV